MKLDAVRESPALDVIELLRAKGADVRYHDPYVPVIRHNAFEMTGEANLDTALAAAAGRFHVAANAANGNYRCERAASRCHCERSPACFSPDGAKQSLASMRLLRRAAALLAMTSEAVWYLPHNDFALPRRIARW